LCSPVFEKREARPVLGVRRDELWPKVWDWWTRQGFQLSQTGPHRFHGTSFYSRIGLRRELDVILDEAGSATTVDLTFRASVTDEGLVGGAVTAVLFFPVAVLGGALSYSEYETDARNLMGAFWQFLSAASGPGGSGALPVPPPPCTACGAALLPDWKVCPYCGKARPVP